VARLWTNATRGDRAQLAVGVLLVVLLIAGYAIQTRRGGGDGHLPPAISLSSPEARLAAIQLGHRPGPRNGFLGQFSGMLDILVTDCPADTRQQLANMVTRSMRELRRSGIASTPNQVLGGVVGAVGLGSTQECSVLYERYVAKRRRLSAQ
jgi:hypothetical protein